MVASKGRYQAALDKASAMGGTRNILRHMDNRPQGGKDVYTVRGSVAPTTYDVWVDFLGELHCSCEAGRNGQPCWHAAVVKLRQWGEQAARQVAPRVASDSTVPPASRAQALGLRRPLIDESERSAQDLVFAGAGR